MSVHIPGAGTRKRAHAATSSPPRMRARSSERGAAAARPRRRRASGTSSTGTTSTARRAMLCRLRRARAGERGGPQHGDEAVRAALGRREPAGARLVREPRDLVHGRERLPGSRRALVPGRRETPELRSRQRSRRQRHEARSGRSAAAARYGASASRPRLLPLDDRRPAPEELRALLAAAPSSSPIDRPLRRRGETVERRAGGRVGRVLRLGRAAREDALVLVPELDEDDLDRGRPAKEAAERAFETGWLSPSVSTTRAASSTSA